jgi:tetratricopeptide (TPR) repeat protein
MIAWATVLAGGTFAADQSPSLERAAALRADGRLDEALEVLRTASREVKKASGEDSLQLLPINDLAAAILVEKGDLETAEPLITKVIGVRQRLVDAGRGAYSPELAASLMTLVQLQTKAKRFADAASTARRALLLQDKTDGPTNPATGAIRLSLESTLESLDDFIGFTDKTAIDAHEAAATTFVSMGLLGPAVEQRRKVLAGTRGRGDAAAPESLAAAERLCRLMMTAGFAAEAIPIAEDAAKRAATASAPIPTSGLRLVGELQLATGQLTAADASFKAVVESSLATKGLSPIASAIDRLRRLLIDVQRGRAGSLPPWLDQDVRLLTSAPLAERESAAAALTIAAEIYSARGEHARAAEQLNRAAAHAASVKAPSAGTIADLRGRLAAAQIAAGTPAAAIETAKAALANGESSLGPGDPAVSFLRIMLADALRRQGDNEAARKLVLAALERELARPDDDRERLVVGAIDELAAASPDGLLRSLFMESRVRQFGEEHRHVAMAWRQFAAARMAAGDWAAATEFLTRALAGFQDSLGDDHAEVAATRTLLARAELAGGDAARGMATARQGLDAWELLAGSDHPATLATVEVLALGSLQAGEPATAEPLLERLCAHAAAFSDARQFDHLVRLATVLLPHDRDRANTCLQRATALPCWLPDANVAPADGPLIALSAARAAHAFKQLDQPDRAAETLQKARSLATTSGGAAALLDRVESLAERGDR